MKILICGHRSYAARNFKEKLEKSGHEVWCFSRGNTCINGRVVSGPVMELDKNPFLTGISIDVVVNFILLDNQSVEDNLKYVDALCKWCEREGVKRLVNMSSISVLPNSAENIDEETPIDTRPELKGNYGAVKIAVDTKLQEWGKTSSVKVIFVRSGFITAEDKKDALAGIAKVLPGGIALLMGNSKSTLPLVNRNNLQRGLQNAVENANPLSVYLMVDNGISTKKEYLQSLIPNVRIITLPKRLVMWSARVLQVLGVFDERKVQMVAGLFKVQHFNANKTLHKIEE